MYLKIKTPDADVDITFEGTEAPRGDHFTFVASLLEKMGLAVPEMDDFDWPKADLDPDGWAVFVVDIIQSMEGVTRDAAVRAFAKEMNRRAITVDRPTRVNGGDWAPTETRQAGAADVEDVCGVCGRDNRNGTHDALQKTGHLSHDFVTEQDGRM